MPSRRSARPILTNKRGSVRSDITPSDHERLLWLLSAKPGEVLSWFASCQVTYLIELDSYRYLLEHEPQMAARVRTVASLFGVAEMPDLTQP